MRKRSVPLLLPTFLVLALLGAWAGTGMGQLPPPPTVTLPTVTVPTVPLPPPPPTPPTPPVPTVATPPAPVPTTPKLPVDPPKPPVDVPLPAPVPTPPSPESDGQPGTSPPAGGGGTTSAGRLGGASSRIATISRFRTSRKWVLTTGPESARGVWISFWLSRPGTVVFLVDEIAPECRYVGRFIARGRAGRNSVRFRGRLRGRQLEAGTYRLTAHPRGRRAQPLTGVTVAILDGSPGPAEIATANARNTCPDGIPPSLRGAGVAAAGAASGTDPAGGESTQAGGVAGVQASAADRRPYQDDSSGPFAAASETLQSAADAVPPVLFALALLAVLLLGLAAMPQPVRASRAGATLVHHRGALALAGAGVLIAAVLSFMLLA
jgi:hypothetical protein